MRMFKAISLASLLLTSFASAVTAQQSEMPPARVEAVYFYGQGALDVKKLAAELPVKVGDSYENPLDLFMTKVQMVVAVKRATGLAASDVSYVSPGGDAWLIYVGVAGKSVKAFRYNAAPRGDAKLPEEALKIYREQNEAFMNAMRKGHVQEDDSRGFALSKDDDELRAKQLAMHEYAKGYEAAIVSVLRNSRDAEQRAMAAQFLGYAEKSAKQISALVYATRDADDSVRNNATRALIMLARSDAKTAAMIPAVGFIDMLNSGEWTDRNKASGLLGELTRSRDKRVLATLRAKAVDSLVDMARWAPGHAESARWMLGRIAGIEEKQLGEIVGDEAKVEELIRAAKRKR